MSFDTHYLTDIDGHKISWPTAKWPVTPGYVGKVTPKRSDIDGFGHVNNMVYPLWAMEAAWRHSTLLGYPFERFREMGTGFVISSHQFDYKSPVLENEDIYVATWIADNDLRLRLTRAFEIRLVKDGRLAFQGRTLFISIDMATGRPVRMPAEFAKRYAIAI